MEWRDLTEAERDFLVLCRQADGETRADVLAMLINGRRRDGDGCQIVNIEDARRMQAGNKAGE